MGKALQQTTALLTQDQMAAVKIIAEREEISVAATIRKIVREHLEKNSKEYRALVRVRAQAAETRLDNILGAFAPVPDMPIEDAVAALEAEEGEA